MDAHNYPTLPGFTDFKRKSTNSNTELHETINKRFSDQEQPNTEAHLNSYFKERTAPCKTLKSVTKELAEYFKDLKSPFRFIKGAGDTVHIGIDTEFEYDDKTEKNKILSYQYYLVTSDDKVMREVVYPDSTALKDRFDFNEFIYQILHKAKKLGFISEYPTNTYIYAHFMRADIASFNAYWKIGNKKLDYAKATLGSVRGAYGLDLDAIGQSIHRPQAVMFYDHNRKPQTTRIQLKDTLFLSPGRCSLDVIGKAIGIHKIELPKPYSIEKMSVLLAKNKRLFEQYALRDAEIAVRYGLYMQEFALVGLHKSTKLNLSNLPNTLGNLSVSLFKHVVNAEIDFDKIFGM